MSETPATKKTWRERLLSHPGWLTVLAVVLLLSAILFPYGWRYYRTPQLVAEIEARGGKVRWIIGDRLMMIPWFGIPIRVRGPGGANEQAAVFVQEGNFDDLAFHDFVIPLSELHRIVDLDLGDLLTTKSYETLPRFQNLKILTIQGIQFDNESLKHLRTLTKLRSLALDGTSVTDAGLKHLYGLKHLEALFVSNTDVTEQGLEELQRRLPKLEVYDD